MFARVSTYQGTSETIDRSLDRSDEVVPVVRGLDGSRGLIYLFDRGSGKSVSITLWESAEAMQASEEAANRIRRDSADASGETIVGVDRFEVGLLDLGEGS
jgi:heme-degrading monooxygenase HmoA